MTSIGRLRLAELGLLVPALTIALAGASILLLQHGAQLSTEALLPALALAVLFVVAHWWLIIRQPGADQTLLPLVAGLTALGQVVVTRVEPRLGPRQLAWLVVALIGWAIVIWLPRPVRWLAGYRYTFGLAGVALLASTLVLGVDPNGSGVRIWLGFGGYYFQPSEMIKVVLVIFLAGYLEEARDLIGAGQRLWRLSIAPTTAAYLLPIAAMCGIALGLLLVQKDLGPAFLFMAVTLAMLYLATGRLLYVATGAAAFIGGGLLAYRLFNVARVRFDMWLDPWSDASGRGYQIIQGLVAIANGGVFGVGFGFGHPEILPAAHTDFPFAVIAEELGMVGAMAILIAFALLAMRGFAVAARARDTFGMLLAGGLVTAVTLQTLIITAGNLKLMPLTGITLPFVSYGGSSLLTNFLILGLLHRISAEASANDPAAP